MKKITLLIALFATTISFAQTTLSAGDLVIVGLKGDSTDQYAFVLLKDITTGTVIHFTDNGWLASGSFRGGESISTFTADQFYSKGTLITVSGTTSDTRFSQGLNALATTGDQIIAYQGTATSPTFIFAIQSNSSTWQSDATNSQTSALPKGLINGVTAVAAGAGTGSDDEYDNIWYSGNTTGTAAEILAAVANNSMWTGNNNFQSYIDNVYTSDFTIRASLLSNSTNPKLDEFNIKTTNGKILINQGKIAAIYNLLGQKVNNKNLDGIYIVVINQGNSTKTFKVLL